MVDSKLTKSLKEATKEFRNAFFEKICVAIDCAVCASVNGKVPYGFVIKMINKTKAEEPWINKNIISFAWKKFYGRNDSKGARRIADNQHDDSSKKSSRCEGGRLKGTTLLMKRHLKEFLIAVKNKITSMYHEKRNQCKKKG